METRPNIDQGILFSIMRFTKCSVVCLGFEVKVITDEKYTTSESGLIFYDLIEGQGEKPKDGQQVSTLISPCST